MTELLARPQAPWALRLAPPFPAIAHRILGLVGQEHINFNVSLTVLPRKARKPKLV
jgi:hypothetical protein